MGERKVLRLDWAIKNILRDKANFDVLEGFLCALLGYEVTILSLLESEGNQNTEDDKFNRVDLMCEDTEGIRIIIEIQTNREVHYLERLLYGTSKTIVDNIKLGNDFSAVKKVISISILYFNYGENADDYVYYGQTEFKGIHTHSTLKLRRKIKDVYKNIEPKSFFPEYYLIEVEKFQDVIESDLDEWIYFLKNESIRDDFKSKNIDKAKDKLDILKLSPEQKEVYERFMIGIARERDIIQSNREESFDEGKKEGIKEGIKAGIKETAKKMLTDGVPVETIMKYTQLSEKELQELN